MTRKKYASKRQILDYNDLIGRQGTYAIVCVPTAALMAARQFLETRGQWLSSYAKSYTENYYEAPTKEELEPLLEEYAEFTEVTHDMNCNDFLQGLQDIADAVRDSGCCSTINGSEGAGPAEAESSTFEDTGENYPDGFTDRAEYDTWKCGVAQLIIDLWRADLEYLKNTDFLAVTAAFVAASLLTPVPGDEIVALVGLGIALVVEGTLAAVTNAVSDAINNNEDELRCIFYNAIDAATLKGDLEDWFAGKLSAIQATFVGYLINYDVLNWVFSKVNQVLPVADCSSCGVPQWDLVKGALISGSLQTSPMSLASETVEYPCGSTQVIALNMPTGYKWRVTVTPSGMSDSCSDNDWWYIDSEGVVTAGSGPWAGVTDQCMSFVSSNTIMMRSSVGFSATVSWVDGPTCP